MILKWDLTGSELLVLVVYPASVTTSPPVMPNISETFCNKIKQSLA